MLCLIACVKNKMRDMLEWFPLDNMMAASFQRLKKSHYVLSITIVCVTPSVNFTSIMFDILLLSQPLSFQDSVQSGLDCYSNENRNR